LETPHPSPVSESLGYRLVLAPCVFEEVWSYDFGSLAVEPSVVPEFCLGTVADSDAGASPE
jgi:hypothetical protein